MWQLIRKHRWFLLLGGIFILAALLRGLEVYTHNYVFVFDQGKYYLQVKKIIMDKKPSLISEAYTPLSGFFQGPWFIYLLAIPFFIFGPDPYWGIVLMFVLGLLAILASFMLVKNLFGLLPAILVAFIFAVYPPAVAASRMVWPPHVIYLLMPFYQRLIKLIGKERSFVFWVFFFASLIAAFEIAVGAMLYLPIIFYLLIFNRRAFTLQNLLLAGAGTTIPLTPQILFNFRHENIMLKGMLKYLRGEVEAGTQKMDLKATFFSHLQTFRENFIALFPEDSLFWKMAFLLLVAWVLFLFLKGCFSKKEKSFLFLLTTFPLLIFLQLMLYPYILWPWYLIGVQVVYIFLIGFLLYKMITFKGKLRLLSLGVIFLLLFQALVKIHFVYAQEIYDDGGTAKIKGKLETIDFIYQDAKGKKFGLFIFSPPIYTYPYDYLLWWYAQRKYGYLPTDSKKGLFYLWIEPDPYKPWTYKGWLETVIRTGKIVKTWELPNGFIIQKRRGEGKN